MSNSQEIHTSKEVVTEEEDYIDMELSNSPSSRLQCHSSPQTREFEFQMSSSATSSADELFYKGKLLPLHLPPRLHMVEKLLQGATTTNEHEPSVTPREKVRVGLWRQSVGSWGVTSSHSQEPYSRVNCEKNPDECFFEWSTEINSFVRNHPKRSWTKKLKKSSLGKKVRASSVYIKSLFSKSGCSDEASYVKPAPNRVGYLKDEKGCISQRRSFSGVIQWHPSSKSLSPSSVSTSSSGLSSSSSSFSFSSNNGFHDLHFLRRSGCASSELEGSIEGAIAHCKMSHQQLIGSRKASSSDSD